MVRGKTSTRGEITWDWSGITGVVRCTHPGHGYEPSWLFLTYERTRDFAAQHSSEVLMHEGERVSYGRLGQATHEDAPEHEQCTIDDCARRRRNLTGLSTLCAYHQNRARAGKA